VQAKEGLWAQTQIRSLEEEGPRKEEESAPETSGALPAKLGDWFGMKPEPHDIPSFYESLDVAVLDRLDLRTPMDARYVMSALALGSVSQAPAGQLPVIDLRSPSAPVDPIFRGVPPAQWTDARRVVVKAYRWCSASFPLVTPSNANGVTRLAINHIHVRLTPGDELLSASFANKPGYIVVGAPWPTGCTYRLASLIAHEAVHQGLFVREASGSPVRRGSLGYSPWRRKTRSGRLVWHAFWTFACQFVLLADAVAQSEEILLEEPALLDLMATMPYRVESCFDSLREFGIVAPPELDRCLHGLRYVQSAAGRLIAFPRFAAQLQEEQRKTDGDYRAWVEQVLDAQESAARGPGVTAI